MQITDFALEAFVLCWFLALAGLMFIVGRGRLGGGSADFETRRLYFAATILSGLGLLFLFSMGFYLINNDTNEAANEVFDTVKTAIPPVVTLVLGYYFGEERGRSSKGASDTEASEDR